MQNKQTKNFLDTDNMSVFREFRGWELGEVERVNGG